MRLFLNVLCGLRYEWFQKGKYNLPFLMIKASYKLQFESDAE